MLNRYINRIRFFFLLLFIGYTIGITLFTHSHVIDGVTIVHSHPYSKDVKHSHTTVELKLIHMLSHFDSLTPVIVLFSLAFIALYYRVVTLIKNREVYSTPYFGLTYLRGPPAVDFIL